MNRFVTIVSCLALLVHSSLSVIPPAIIPSAIEAIYNDLVKHDVTEDAKQAGAIPLGGLAILVIDQQVSFHPGGSLAIPTANEDATRIAAFITNHTSELSQVVLTMDSHQRYHIAHGIFWKNEAGESPQPFTTISSQDIKNGVWKPRDSSLKDYVLAYTQSLEASGKFSLTIWPEHCIIGSPGHNIVPNVLASALEWTKKSLKPIQYVMKGSNPFTEHYSALKAEYELPYDPSTSLNTALIKSLQRASKIVIVGEALSHCVNYTVRDLVAAWPKKRLSDLVILTDCSSPVPGFEEPAKQFLRDMEAKGVTLTTSADFIMGQYARESEEQKYDVGLAILLRSLVWKCDLEQENTNRYEYHGFHHITSFSLT